MPISERNLIYHYQIYRTNIFRNKYFILIFLDYLDEIRKNESLYYPMVFKIKINIKNENVRNHIESQQTF